MSASATPLDVERAVRERYAAAARAREAALCCPVAYDPRYLDAVPPEVLERDYGCGDPSPHVRPGDTVLDLGSGGGKIWFIAAQIAGPEGRVLGVDVNDEMLALARLRAEQPLVPDASVDFVASNCVLNLVREDGRRQLFRELHCVLREGGRIAISDIVSNEDVPAALRDDPELWSGCVSGAFREDALLRELEEVGFQGIALESWNDEPFRVLLSRIARTTLHGAKRTGSR